MPEVNRYRVVLYGSSTEAPNLKAKIELYAAPKVAGASAAVTVGKIKFHDGLPALPADKEEKGVVQMHLPSNLLAPVMDLLRNEAPVYFAFHEGRGVLGTGVEPIGTRDEGVAQLVRIVDGPEAARPVPASPKPPA